MKKGKQWIDSAEVEGYKWDDGETRWTFQISILDSEKPDAVMVINSRVFDEYSDCLELMQDRIHRVFIENEENGWGFDEKEAEKRFNKETYTTREVA